MKDSEKRRFQAACRNLSQLVGTPGFNGALARFYAALAAIRPETRQ
jgi:hypothetical protein